MDYISVFTIMWDVNGGDAYWNVFDFAARHNSTAARIIYFGNERYYLTELWTYVTIFQNIAEMGLFHKLDIS